MAWAGPLILALDATPQIGLLGKLTLERCAAILSHDGLGFSLAWSRRGVLPSPLPLQEAYRSANCALQHEPACFFVVNINELAAPQQSGTPRAAVVRTVGTRRLSVGCCAGKQGLLARIDH